MKKIRKTAIVPYSCEQMFKLVNDVESYPQFMTGVVGAKVLEKNDGVILATLVVKKLGLSQQFSTRNTLTPFERIDLALVDGPFSHFKGAWVFKELSTSACKVIFDLEFKFSSRVLALAGDSIFEKVSAEQVLEICARAKEVYG